LWKWCAAIEQNSSKIIINLNALADASKGIRAVKLRSNKSSCFQQEFQLTYDGFKTADVAVEADVK